MDFSPIFADKKPSVSETANDGVSSPKILILWILNGMVSTTRWTCCIHILYRELGVHTTEKYAYSKHEYSNIYIYTYHIHISSYLCLEIEMKSTPTQEKKRNTTSTVTPTATTSSNIQTSDTHRNPSKSDHLKVTGSSQRVRRSRCCGLTKTKSCVVMPGEVEMDLMVQRKMGPWMTRKQSSKSYFPLNNTPEV